MGNPRDFEVEAPQEPVAPKTDLDANEPAFVDQNPLDTSETVMVPQYPPTEGE